MNQVVKSGVTGAVTSGVLIVAPVAAVNWKVAVVTSRVFEKPWIATLNCVPLRVIVVVETTGIARGMTMTTGCRVVGVTSMPWAVRVRGTVIVPATVPA